MMGNAALQHNAVFRGFFSVLMNCKCAQSTFFFGREGGGYLHLVWANPGSFLLQKPWLVCCNLLAVVLGKSTSLSDGSGIKLG